MTERGTVVVVDGDSQGRARVGAVLAGAGYAVRPAGDLAGAVALLDPFAPGVVVADAGDPPAETAVLRHLLERRPRAAVIVVSAAGSVAAAVDALKLGACDYLTRPVDEAALVGAVERARQRNALAGSAPAADRPLGRERILSEDPAMAHVFELITAVANSRLTVLLTGESGTGKSLIARALHHASARAAGPFVEVSCGALSETLIESELFGHLHGAFTGAVCDKAGKLRAAEGGTLFLDEVATASPGLQVKLLRVLQDRQFEPVGSDETLTADVRIVLATHVDLEAAVRAGQFREDLYYRINVVNITVPPLRDRPRDIVPLAQHFLRRGVADFDGRAREISPAALRVLQAADWPGNVRELQNAIERAVVLCRHAVIDIEDLPAAVQARGAGGTVLPLPRSLHEALADPEKRIIQAALDAHGWNRQATADALQINRTTLYKKMKRHGLVGDSSASSPC